ncbi:MAG: HNH endonuclease [Erysipelotrichaceae bacterium]|nr:HNH endonuclease [Erysipelotrichaceae bacterium]
MKRKYFWLNANFDEWRFTSLCPGESEGFSVFNSSGNRRFNPKAYASVREGDIALGYQGNPVGQIITIGRITAVPHDTSNQSSEIIFTKLVDLKNGVTKDELKNRGLTEIQPITARSGTFFPLEDDEYLSILQVIEEKNPGILDNKFLKAGSSLAERIDNIDIQSAVEYAKRSGTYYLGGKLFEYRNYTANELKKIIGVKKLSPVMSSIYDSTMTLADLKNYHFMDWKDNNTSFTCTCSFEYNQPKTQQSSFGETSLDRYVHVFDEIQDDVFQYLGPAMLELKETVLSAEPDEKYDTWLYTFVVEGSLLATEDIVDAADESIFEIKDVEKDIPQGLKGYERETVIKERINQSGFRKNLIKKYGKCCICGVESAELLLASHIKPWKDSDEDEKGSTSNGLLLCPNHDKLFDRGLISFNDDGTILISEKLSENDRMFMNVNDSQKIQVTSDMIQYLAFHREKCFKK